MIELKVSYIHRNKPTGIGVYTSYNNLPAIIEFFIKYYYAKIRGITFMNNGLHVRNKNFVGWKKKDYGIKQVEITGWSFRKSKKEMLSIQNR